MKIYSGDKLAESVKIGDPLKIVVNIDEQEKYGLHVTDCSVRDGIGLGEQKLLDNHGCPLDQDILGPFTYDSERTKATVTFPAHKFPYTTSVYYQCNIRLCLLSEDNCHKTPSCDRSSRIKRETDGSDDGLPATIEVFSGEDSRGCHLCFTTKLCHSCVNNRIVSYVGGCVGCSLHFGEEKRQVVNEFK